MKNTQALAANQPLLDKLQSQVRGDLLTGKVHRGQYATDASIYQVMPQAVLLPKNKSDIVTAIELAAEYKCPVLPRGGGTSQNGQTVNDALVVDNCRYFNQLLDLDVAGRRCRVQPGMILDTLNRLLRPYGLWFPVDVSTSSRATIGGMTGNNSCGQRSIVYGTMRHNVLSVDALLADGTEHRFGCKTPSATLTSSMAGTLTGSSPAVHSTDEFTPASLWQHDDWIRPLLAIGERDKAEIKARFPDVLRRVGGYNLDALIENPASPVNVAHLLVGSEGTLAYTTSIELKLAPIPEHRVLGVCHFPSFYQAMDAAQHLVALGPSAVELVDATMISLARDIEAFRPTVELFVRGNPEALLLVEFARDTHDQNLMALRQLSERMGDLGFTWRAGADNFGGVVEAIEPALQAAIGEVRKSGLNIMMSMKTEGKPVSFVEDCAVELRHLAEYTAGLTELFSRYGTRGTWYAHASVGCLHVRPILNMKLDADTTTMRRIADEAFDLVLKYKGSNSGEHGDGISRAEFYPKMFGDQLVGSFAEVKRHFDPDGLFNPGRIIDPPRMNDRKLLRFHPEYRAAVTQQHLDWSQWPEAKHGFQGAVEMCNNNGACRKLAGGSMCPSYRVSREEKHVTRGRANALRLALGGEFGDHALISDEIYETLKLCVSCKACKSECPTGVDMARMKLEVLAARHQAGKSRLHDYLIAYLPRYAPWLTKFPAVGNLRNRIARRGGRVAAWLESITGFSSNCELPEFGCAVFSERKAEALNAKPGNDLPVSYPGIAKPTVLLWVDTFNRYFEGDNISAAIKVLHAAGYTVELASDAGRRSRPLCCGRTFLTAGMVSNARAEMQRTMDAILPRVKAGAVLVGLEPSCLLTLRDEIHAVLPGAEAQQLSNRSFLFEEFLACEHERGHLQLALKKIDFRLLLHGHCHQKAFNVMSSVETVLQLIPDCQLSMIESSCCGMAGSFGLHHETVDVSRQMAELSLLPAVRAADPQTLIVADGTSCRQQIRADANREALHVSRILEMALE